MYPTKRTLALALLLAFPMVRAQAAQTTGTEESRSAGPTAAYSYAQHLLESISKLHPELLDIELHARLPGQAQSTIVAAKSPDRVGRPSTADDIAPQRSGQPRVEINRRGDQNADVEVQLFDIFKQVIGSVRLTVRYVPGTDEAALIQQALQYRDELSRRILDLESLGAPAQLDPNIRAQTYAQFLIDDSLTRHPEVEVLALHARTPRTGADYPIVASNIGRFGKPAERADLDVIESGKPHGAVDAPGARYEWKVPIADAAGRPLGVLAVVFPHKRSSDPERLQHQAEKIATEIGQRISGADQLVDPYPESAPGVRLEALKEYNKQELGNKQDLPMTREVSSGAAIGQTQEGYTDAIKNVAGLAPTNSSGSANDAFAIRGIKLNLFSNYRIDGGLPIAGVITTPTENKERVETLKGANALMFGVASPAGIINFVTKRAGDRDITTVGLAGNWFGQFGGAVDVGRRFGAEKSFGVRLNASAVHLENGVRDMGGNGQFASLGLDYRATSRLTLQADLEYYHRHVPEQAGISLLPAVKGIVPLTPVPDPRNLLSGRWDMYTPTTKNVQGRVDYVLTDSWKVFAQAGYSGSDRHRTTVRIGGYDIVTGAHGAVAVQPVTNDYRNVFYRTEALGHFSTWSVLHDLTVGISYTQRHSATSDVQNVVLPQKQNIFDPIPLDPPVYTKPGTTNPAQSSNDRGLYTYDTITVTPRTRLLLGVRAVQDDEVVGATTTTSHVTSPAYGVLFDVRPTTTLFASYLEGLEAGGTAPANAANANVTLSPAISKQKEIGLRDSYFKGLAISASYFDITRGNAVTDPVTNIFGYSGNLSYKGVESTIAYQLTRSWRFNGAVQYLKAKQNSPVQPLLDGKTPENTPTWNGNVGIQYSVLEVPGLQLRAGVRSISKRPINAQNQGNIPGYSLFDAGLSYGTRIHGHLASFNVNVDNLGNKRYWNSVNAGTYGIGMDRSIKFAAKADF